MESSSSSLKKYGATVSYRAVEDDSRGTSSASSVSEEGASFSRRRERRSRYISSTKRYLASEVDGLKVTAPLVGYAFMTGYIDAISFSTIFVWCGFQTGNFAQLALAFAREIESYFLNPRIGILGALTSLSKSEQQSACSILAFFFGLATVGRLGDKIGTHTRGWLFSGTIVQALLTLASSMTFWNLEGISQPLTGNVLERSASPDSPLISAEFFFGVACLSASFGVQGIMARRLNTDFSTTIVLTGVFVELVTEPSLFQVNRSVRSRDQKWLAAGSLFFGVVIGRLILGQLGTALTIGIGALIRVAIAISWLFIPEIQVHLP